jgi:hypothetical protein
MFLNPGPTVDQNIIQEEVKNGLNSRNARLLSLKIKICKSMSSFIIRTLHRYYYCEGGWVGRGHVARMREMVYMGE